MRIVMFINHYKCVTEIDDRLIDLSTNIAFKKGESELLAKTSFVINELRPVVEEALIALEHLDSA